MEEGRGGSTGRGGGRGRGEGGSRGLSEGTAVPRGGQGEVNEVSRGHLSDVGVEMNESLQRRSETGGEIVASD